jgi:PKD repeat protein
MNTYTKKLLTALVFCLSVIGVKAQLPYSETFDIGFCNTSFPSNWTTGSTTADWLIDDNSTSCFGGVPECNIAGSSGGSVLAGADGTGNSEAAVTASFSTVGFNNITVDWNGYRSTGAPTVVFEYSFDDNTYVPVTFTDVNTDDAWHTLSTITLPSACDNVPVLYLRWSYTSTNGGAFIAFDDLNVSGTSLTTFYWNGTGALHQLTSWGINPNGTGANPNNFTTGGYTFNMYNNTTTTFNAALTANWSVSGGSVNINLGDGVTRATNFTIPSTFSLALSGTTLNVVNNATLTLQNTVMPASALVNVGVGSTMNFAQTSTVSLYPKTYSNLTISGANKSQNGNTTVNGVLNLASATSNFVMANSSLQSLTLNGTITGSGSILTGNSRLTIGGTGTFGTITFGVGTTTRTINQLTINRTSTGSVTIGSNLTVTGSSSFTNGRFNLNGNLLTLNGAVTLPASASNGALVGSTTSSLTIGGSGAITNSLLFDQTSAATRSMRDVTLNRTGQTLTLGNALEIWGSITPTVGTIASGSNLTIKSDNSSKGRIGIIGASGAFTGNPTVEVYKAAGATNWVNLCSGGVVGGTMSQWNTSFAITCQSCPDGWTVGSGTFTSIYTYDETTFVGDDANAAHYIEITALGGVSSTEGYWVYLGNGNVTTTAITMSLQGSGVNTKNSISYNLSLTAPAPAATDGWNLISNPYPSPILVSQVIASAGASNVDNSFYVFDSNANTSVVYSASGSNSVIPMGQAFSVRALVNGVNITPNENWKTVTLPNTGLAKMNLASSTPNYFFDDFLIDLSSTTISTPFFSSAYFNFDPSATLNFDNGKDSYLIGNSVDPGQPVIYSTSLGGKYIRNAQPLLSSGTTIIPLTVRSGIAGTFKLSPVNISKLPAGACVKLYDIANNIMHDLKTGPYTQTVAANATVPQFELRISISPATISSTQNDPTCLNSTNGSIVAQGSSTGPWSYTWKDMSNNIIKVSNNKPGADTLNNLAPGNYKVDVASATAACSNASATYTLNTVSPMPNALFAVNNNSLNITGPVQFQFTNNSTNANTYFWTFGDGNTSTLQNPAYMYSTPGSYVVTLHAINSVCGDTTTFNSTVYAYMATGLAELNSDGSIKVGKDAAGVYVQLNFDKSTKATVNVTNVLGQTLIAPRAIEGTTERFYIDVNSKEQVLFVTVTTGEKRVTERLFNN